MATFTANADYEGKDSDPIHLDRGQVTHFNIFINSLNSRSCFSSWLAVTTRRLTDPWCPMRNRSAIQPFPTDVFFPQPCCHHNLAMIAFSQRIKIVPIIRQAQLRKRLRLAVRFVTPVGTTLLPCLLVEKS